MGTAARGGSRRWPSRSRRSLALMLSAALHVAVLGWFALKRAVEEFRADVPAVNVELVRLRPPPPPANAPSQAATSSPPDARLTPTPPSDLAVAPRPAGPTGAAPAAPRTGIDPRWAVDLNGPVFADGKWPRPIPELQRCDPLKDPNRESRACRRVDAVARGVTRANDPQEGKGDFAREARRNEAVKRYRDLPGGAGYPGIRCQIFHRC
ncbi:hypothetical protein [Phenylobacterium sp.]|uniref:hypothetical protein n=1 Tax=Phenylobacterium sp. TaxID=1871053 RepID=UPI0025EB04ED|nr:hypothetical protein [Phenylobacterium sp.]